LKIHSKSAWSEAEIIRYLDQANTPVRVSCSDADDYPIVCSLWYVHHKGELWAASHKNSHIVKVLKKNPKIGFEVATNEYPYHGVRGKADVTLHSGYAEDILEQLIAKYLKGSNKDLANWLLSRKEDEYAIKIAPVSLNSWDFSGRMTR